MLIYLKKYSNASVWVNKMIFDTHCHLNDDQIYKDLELNIQEANNVRVKSFLVVGYDKTSSLRAVEIAHKYPNCWAAIGFHPTEIQDLSEEDYDEVMKLAKDPKVKAIGEIGLDYHWVKDPILKEIQKEYFIRQIEFANYVGLPISIHNREATEDILKILKEYKPIKGGIMHCYSGSVEIMDEFLKLVMYISLGGPVTFTNAKTPKEVAETCPLDRLLVETDCPYLAPHPLRGTVNLPKNIALIVDEIAILRDMSKKTLEDVTYKNACTLLNINE